MISEEYGDQIALPRWIVYGIMIMMTMIYHIRQLLTCKLLSFYYSSLFDHMIEFKTIKLNQIKRPKPFFCRLIWTVWPDNLHNDFTNWTTLAHKPTICRWRPLIPLNLHMSTLKWTVIKDICCSYIQKEEAHYANCGLSSLAHAHV